MRGARRLRPGAAVRLVDGAGSVGTGTIERFDRAVLEVRVDRIRHGSGTRVLDHRSRAGPSGVEAGVARREGDRARRGEDRPRGVVARPGRSGGGARSETALGSAASRAKRRNSAGGRRFLRSRARFRSATRRFVPADRRLLLDPSGDPFPPSLSGRSLALWAGPEGGFTPAELSAAGRAGWENVRLAGSVLRAETAVLAALALAARAIDSAAGRADNSPTP